MRLYLGFWRDEVVRFNSRVVYHQIPFDVKRKHKKSGSVSRAAERFYYQDLILLIFTYLIPDEGFDGYFVIKFFCDCCYVIFDSSFSFHKVLINKTNF